MPPRNFYAITIVALLSILCHVKADQTRNGALVGETIALIERFYVDDVDERELLEAAMGGLTKTLDPYTQFIPPAAYETFQNSIQQEFAGIGILIDQPEGMPVRVVTPLVGSPALAAGFRPKDEIVAVDGTDTSSMQMDEVSRLLRGPIGSKVLVRVRRAERQPADVSVEDDSIDGLVGAGEETPGDLAGAQSNAEVGLGRVEELEFQVERESIQLESVSGDYRDVHDSWVYQLRENPKIAYVRLSGFGERTTKELELVLKGIEEDSVGLILDLRQNSGGLLSAAVEVCDMFLGEGRIVSTRGRGVLDPRAAELARKDQVTWDATPGTLVKPDFPVYVLIDGDSASAAEIVAACLQDHQRASIVGTRSYGKGSVQNVFDLESGRSALKLTTARYYRPSGENIHRGVGDTEDQVWGVLPDDGFEVPVDEEQFRKILLRWELATYPTFAKAPEENRTLEKLREQDPQLWRAVEAILAEAAR